VATTTATAGTGSGGEWPASINAAWGDVWREEQNGKKEKSSSER